MKEGLVMRIAHYINALNVYNKMNQNNKQVNQGIEKLSSGLRINKAADDSAGLAISEKMRAQIRGLERAEQNIKDGISLIQTAEAGLAEIANPNLIRLRELAIQAANETLTLEDRQLIQQEMNKIIEGIDQIANDTEFNTMKLLNGTNPNPGIIGGGGGPAYNYENVLKVPPVNSNGSFTFGTDEGYPTSSEDDNKTLVFGTGGTSYPSVRIDDVSYRIKAAIITPTVEEDGVYKTVYTIPDQDVEVTQFVSVVKDKYEIKYTIKNNGNADRSLGFQYHIDTMLGNDDRAPFVVDGVPVDTQTVYEGNNIPDDFIVYNESTGIGENAELQAGGIIKGEGIIEDPSKFAVGNYSSVSDWDFDSNTGSVGDSGYSIWWDQRAIGSGDSFSVNTFYGQSVPPTIDDPTDPTNQGPYDLLLQVGANTQQHFKVQLSDVRANKLGIKHLNVLSNANTNQSLGKIDKAIQLVTAERTKYGAYQNVLEHIGKNVSNYHMNITGAESRLRDLDMSKEMMKLTNSQVVLQAAQAMLPQANQISQSILQFLK